VMLPTNVSESVLMIDCTIAARDADAPSASMTPTTAARVLIFIRI
jgi:tartrate dehydratase beta subunit/fumarate hydratase class I family protein